MGKNYYDKAIVIKDITNIEALVKVQIYEVEVNWCYSMPFHANLTADNSQNSRQGKTR